MTDEHIESASLAYDIGDGEMPSMAVVRAVAELTDTGVIDLAPLYDTVDPDNLDIIMADADETRSVAFDYGGCRVVVSDDTVRVQRE